MKRIKVDNLNNKLLFKLSEDLFNQELHTQTQSKYYTYNTLESLKIQKIKKESSKNSIITFHKPKRFQKHNNKVQSNMKLSRTTADYRISTFKTHSNSFSKSVEQIAALQSGFKTQSFQRQLTQNVFQQKQKINLVPKTYSDIRNFYNTKYRQKIQRKTQIIKHADQAKSNSKRINMEISQNYNDNKHQYLISRFTKLQLKSYYCSILNYAKGSMEKFKQAFEIMLNLANITLRQSIISQCLKDFALGQITFKRFLYAFTKIQEKLRKEVIIDYFQIFLQDMDKKNITYEQLVGTFEGRMKTQIAQQLTNLVYEKLGKEVNQFINKEQIHRLCYQDEQFCSRFFILNSENKSNSKIKNSQLNQD